MNIKVEKTESAVKFSIPVDKDFKRLRLLVIISPILIGSFDNGNRDLLFLKKTIEKSKFPYGLYPHFIENFDISSYEKAYEDYEGIEDIILRDESIEFYINPMADEYIISLKTILTELLLDDESLNYYLDYFKGMRDDIVINGRRSILANGIQGFYLNKYVVVWILKICEYILNKSETSFSKVKPIYNLASNLKTPRLIGKS